MVWITHSPGPLSKMSVSGGYSKLVWDGVLASILLSRCIRSRQNAWREIDGPLIAKPERTGFGSVVTRKLVASMFDAAIEAEFRPAGFAWTLECPLAKVTGRTGTEKDSETPA